MLESYSFFSQQIVQAVLAGALLASVGVFVVLRRMIFVGLATAQASAMCFAFLLVFGASAFWLLPLTALCMLPFLNLQRAPGRSENREAHLAAAFVFFFALTELLVSLGARAEMHVVQAFSGNVLNMPELPWWLLLGGSSLFLIVFQRSFGLFSRVFLDREQSVLHGDNPAAADFVFFLLLFSAASLGTMQLGAYYTMAHLIVPAAAVIPVSRSIGASWISAVLIAALATIAGFSISFMDWEVSGEVRHVPSSSAVIACLGLCFLGLRAADVIRSRVNRRRPDGKTTAL